VFSNFGQSIASTNEGFQPRESVQKSEVVASAVMAWSVSWSPHIAIQQIVDGGAMRNDPWRHMVDVLAAASRVRIEADEGAPCPGYARHEAAFPVATQARKRPGDGCTEARINIIERLSPTRLVVCWCDATTGRYGEQPWKLCAARNKSVCALSGAKISRGDKVYRPWSRGQRKPANANQSILASAVGDI
jgi:hypothetical protein